LCKLLLCGVTLIVVCLTFSSVVFFGVIGLTG
jgi:hypothetical protein